MILTRNACVQWWLNEPVIEPVPDGCVRLDFSVPPFPDLADLNPQERAAMRDVIAKHPEYMNEIVMSPNEPIQ